MLQDGAFALFCRPHPGGFDRSRVPTPGNLLSKAKNANARGSARGGRGGWVQLELTDALYSSIYSLVVFLFRATIGRLCIFTALGSSPSNLCDCCGKGSS